MDLLKQDTVTAINDLVDDWHKKMTLFDSKEEVRQNTGAAFTMFVNLVKPMMTPELSEQFMANPLMFLATGDQVAATETWSMVREDCNKQMVEMKNFFDKKFDDSIKNLAKSAVVKELKQQQSDLSDKMAEGMQRVNSLEKVAISARDATRHIVNELEQEEQERAKQSD